MHFIYMHFIAGVAASFLHGKVALRLDDEQVIKREKRTLVTPSTINEIKM